MQQPTAHIRGYNLYPAVSNTLVDYLNKHNVKAVVLKECSISHDTLTSLLEVGPKLGEDKLNITFDYCNIASAKWKTSECHETKTLKHVKKHL